MGRVVQLFLFLPPPDHRQGPTSTGSMQNSMKSRPVLTRLEDFARLFSSLPKKIFSHLLGRNGQAHKFLFAILIVALACMSSSRAMAFDSGDDQNTTGAFGDCRVQKRVISGFGVAEVIVFDKSSLARPAGGKVWAFGTMTTLSPLTRDVIADCLGVSLSDVPVLSQNGPDGTYGTDDYIGFKFTLLTAAGGLTAGEHEYKVGTGSLAPPSNTVPTADAGPNASVASAATVGLDGSGSDANDAGQSLTYAWTQVAGPTVALDDATLAAPGFTAPTLAIGDADATLTFELVVNDGVDPSPADSVTITVTAPLDTDSPTISVGALNGPTSGTYTSAITLSEDSTDFDASDLTLVNATAVLTGAGRNYTATLTPDADGTVSLSVAANTFTDAAGNGNEASNTVSAVFDGTAPTVSISGVPASLAVGGSFAVTVTFSENVTGFVANDISITNATVTNLSGSDASYVAMLRASGTGDVQVSIPAGVAIDAAGNGNLASNQVTIADVTVEQTQELIASYMQSRANQLIRNQPGLTPFLSGGPQGGYNVVATRGNGSFDFATGMTYPAWVQVNGAWTTDGDSRSEYMFAALGSHRAINENLLIGVMLQFDHLSEDTGVASVNGTGWMAGPYFVARSAIQPLYFEGRLLYGETSNRISPFGTYEDSFNTTRMLAQLRVAGELSYGTTTLKPFLDASYTTDDQHSYVDSLGNAIPEQGIALGQIEAGMDFSTMMPVRTGELELWGGVSGIWSHTNGSGFASSVTPDYEGGRARVDLGINYQLPADQRFTAAIYYDGIGASGFESYGLDLGYEMQF